MCNQALKIGIAEDDFLNAYAIAEMVKDAGHEVTWIESNPIFVKQHIVTKPVDLVLLDLNFNDNLAGIELASVFQKRNIPFIVISAYSNQKILKDVFQYKPLDYIVKPFTEDQIRTTFFDIHAKIDETQKRVITLVDGKKVHMIPSREFLYMETEGVYCKVFTTDKQLIIRTTLKDVLARNPEHSVLRIHKSIAINPSKVSIYKKNAVTIGEKELTISDKFKLEVEEYMTEMLVQN